jgi:hypothetical protein
VEDSFILTIRVEDSFILTRIAYSRRGDPWLTSGYPKINCRLTLAGAADNCMPKYDINIEVMIIFTSD